MNYANRPLRALMAALAISAGTLAGCASTPHYTSSIPVPRPLSRMPGSADDLRIASGALQSGDLQLAASLYEKALKTDPRSVEANLGLGDCLFQAGDMERARIAYGRAAAVAPDLAAPRLALARVALRQRRFDDAEQRYRALLAQTPEDPAASAGLGTLLDLKGEHDEAQAIYRRALASHPDSMALRIDLGLSLTLSNRPREGANVLLDVAGIADAPPQARQDLAFAYGLLGNDDAAEKILLADLPKTSVQDNLRYYARVRGALNRAAAPDQTSSASVAPVPGVRVSAVPGAVPTTVASSKPSIDQPQRTGAAQK